MTKERHGGNSGFRVTPTQLRTTIRLLRLLGYKFSTVSQALAAPYGRYACLTLDAPDRATFVELKPVLASHQIPGTIFVATAQSPGHLGWKRLKSLLSEGWEVGSLGRTASDLTSLSSSEQRRLVSKSRAAIARQVGSLPEVFAYPFGAYDATTLSCVKDEGFKASVTLRPGLNTGSADPLHLRRLPLTGQLVHDASMIVRAAMTKIKDGPLTLRPLQGKDAAVLPESPSRSLAADL